MKVLFITNLFPIIEDIGQDVNTKALYNLTKYWNCEVEVIRPVYLPSAFKNYITNIRKNNNFYIENIKVNVLPVWKVPKTNTYFYNNMVNQVKRKKDLPDVIITHRLHCAIGAAKLANQLNKPLIVGLHNSDVLYIKKNKENYFLSLFEQALYIACRSHSIYNEISKIFPQFVDKYFVAYSGVESGIIIPVEQSFSKLKEWRNKERPIRFITASRLKGMKNIDVNLKAMSMLDSTIDWEYFILGDGPEMKRLKDTARNLGIDNKVFFLGNRTRDEVLMYMEKSDVFIMVSAPETFGLAYIEAMAKGCMVIGATNNGVDGIVQDGLNGFLCQPLSYEEIHIKLDKLFKMGITELINILSNSNDAIKLYTEESASVKYYERVRTAL